MSRRKHLALRKPCGRLVRTTQEIMSPNEIRRLVDSASSGLRDATFGTLLGRLYLSGKIASSEYAAGKFWSELVANYSIVCRSPRPPRTLSFDTPGGTPLDPDSEQGALEVEHHERITARYLSGRNALRLAGSAAERVVDSVCVQDRAPAGLHELDALRTGLQSLSTWWSARRKAGPR